MTAINWKNNAGGNWNTGANWSTGTVPGAQDDVTVNTPSAQTITYTSGSDTILSLYFGSLDTLALSGGKLAVTGDTTFYGNFTETGGTFQLGANSNLSGTIAQTSGTLSISTGTLTLNGPVQNFGGALTGATADFAAGNVTIAAGATISLAEIELSGATITTAESLTEAGTWLQSSGTLSLGGNTLTLAGSAALDGGVIVGSGQVLLSGQTEISGSFAEEGQIGFVNTGTISQTGYFYLGYNGTDTSSLINKAGAVFQMQSDSYLGSSTGATLTNAGTLIKQAGGGISTVTVNTVSTGTITVASGDLRFQTGNDNFGGTVNGAGELELLGGTDVLANKLSISVGTLLLDGATVNLGGALSYGGVFEDAGGTLALGANTLTLSNEAALDGGVISGSGTLAVTGTTDLSGYYVTGSAVLDNSGTLIQTGTNYIGYSGSDTAQFVNAAGATWQIDGASMLYGQTGDKITNAGSLVKATGAGAAYFEVSVTDTGTTAIDQGSLQFAGGSNVFSGAISGPGTLTLSGAADDFAKGIKLTTAEMLQTAGVLTIGTKLSYAGAWSQTSGTLSLGNQSLTLTGALALDGGQATGSGKISAKTSELGNYALTGSVSFTNTGTATVTNAFYDGYYSGDTATLINAAKAVLTIQGNNTIYGAVGSTLVNDGTLSKANGSGTSQVSVSTASTGTITAASGDLRFSGGTNSFAGTINGAGTVELNAGADSLASGLKVTVGTLLLDGATVTLGGALTLADNVDFTSGTLSLGGYTLTLSAASFDGGTVSGAGTVALSGTTGFTNTTFTGSETLANSGTIAVTSSDYIGYNSSDTVTLENLAGATLRLNAGAILYGDNGSSISNAGTFVKNGAATSTVVDNFTTTALTTIAAGTLRLQGPVDSLGGTLNGAGTLELIGGAVSIAAGTSLKTGAVLLDGANVTLSSALTYAGGFTQTTGTLSISGASLTLSGTDAWSGGVVTGSGTLAVTGTEAIAGSGAVEGSATLSNSGTILQTSSFYVGYNSTDTATLQNNAAGVLDIENGSALYGNASSSIDNLGRIVKTGSAETVINPAITNVGSISLAQGSMAFAGTVSGTGTITAGASTTLIFQEAVGAGGTVVLDANTVLGVNTSAGFGDTIQGFAAGDLIDLNGLGYGATNTFTYNGSKDTLVVSNGSSSATLTLSGSYNQNSFALINDHGVIGITHT
jgi:hypothetical protein